MEITVLIKSSSSTEPRNVLVLQDDVGLSIFCDCPAGERGRVCKPRKAVASGNDSMLYDEDQRENFNRIMELISQTGYPELMKELEDAENEMDTEKEKVIDLKKKIAGVMKDGLK